MSARDNRSPELERDEGRIIELARRAYQTSQPDEDEIDRGARRVARRLRGGSTGRRVRRPMVALAFAVAFGGALAYAATGGRQWFSSKPAITDVPEDEPETKAPKPGTGSAAAPFVSPIQPSPPAAPTETPAPTPSPAPTAGTPTTTTSTGTSTSTSTSTSTGASKAGGVASSWRAVDQALLARDDAKAEKALGGLATSKDPTTRAKAELGLAQLARARGDCEAARRHARAAGAVVGADPAVLRRAETVAQSCR